MTATNPTPFQASFLAGIILFDHQLEPLVGRKASRCFDCLPRMLVLKLHGAEIAGR